MSPLALRRTLLCALCALNALAARSARAQRTAPTLGQLDHTAWTIRDGAPGAVAALAQTSDGFLWLGTAVGLYRFDGERFERFEPPRGQAMPELSVNALLALSNGALWIGYAGGGVSVLAGGRLTHYAERDGLPSGTLTAFAHDSAGGLWAATTSGLARLVGDRWHPVGPESGFPGGLTTGLLVDRRGTLWAAALAGVYVLPRDARRFAWRAPSLDAPPGGAGVPREAPDGSVWGAARPRGLVRLSASDGGPPPRTTVSRYRGYEMFGLLIDRRANAWLIGDHDGVVRVPLSTASRPAGQVDAAAWQTRSRAEGLSGSTVRALFEDREGTVWVGTDRGLDRFRATKLTPVVLPHPVYGVALAAAEGGAVWAGSHFEPLLAISAAGDRIVAHPAVLGEVSCAYRDLDGGVWVGGLSGLWQGRGGSFTRVALPAEAADAQVQAIAVDRGGALWLSVMGNGRRAVLRRRGGRWARFGAAQGLDGELASVVVADSAGRVWLGYGEDRVARVAGDSVRVFSARDALRVGSVKAIHVRGDRVWVGGTSGLAVLDAADGGGARFAPLGVAGGALRGVTGIVETAGGDLWLNGADGVTRVAAAEVRRALRDSAYRARDERFDARDGVTGPAPQVRPLASAVEGTDGRLWFASESGVAWLDPRHIPRNLVPPPVHVRALDAGGRRYEAAGRVALPARTTALNIAYTALSLAVPERVRFRYRLLGAGARADTLWQDAGARREAIYTNLGPGAYRFQVIAANDDGVWNARGAALDVVIPPTFAETRAFRALCAAAAAGALWLLAVWRQRRAAEAIRARFAVTLAERTRIAQELHDTLLQGFTGVSLQMHAVQRMLSARPAEAADVLAHAARTADATLREARHTVWEMRAPELETNDLPDALAAAAREAIGATPIRLALTVRGDRRPLPHAVEVAALRIGREAVRNAVRHADAEGVELALEYGPGVLRVTVRDDGRGVIPHDMDAARSAGHWGIVGMRERAARAGGSLDIAPAPGGGTQLSVALPIPGAG